MNQPHNQSPVQKAIDASKQRAREYEEQAKRAQAEADAKRNKTSGTPS